MYRKSLLLIVALLLVASVPAAHAAGKGTSMFAIELGNGRADNVSTEVSTATPAYLTPNTTDETNVQAEYWYMFADDYAFNLSGGFGFFSGKAEPNDAATDPKITDSETSFRFRIGGDRVGQVGDRLTLFIGPGLEYWNGKAKEKYEGAGATPDEESPSTSRFGISGRVGGIMKINNTVGIVGRVGDNFGYATAKAKNGSAKLTWWPSSFDAAWGIIYTFGSYAK